jgi:hypothetical protein
VHTVFDQQRSGNGIETRVRPPKKTGPAEPDRFFLSNAAADRVSLAPFDLPQSALQASCRSPERPKPRCLSFVPWARHRDKTCMHPVCGMPVVRGVLATVAVFATAQHLPRLIAIRDMSKPVGVMPIVCLQFVVVTAIAAENAGPWMDRLKPLPVMRPAIEPIAA